MDTTDQCGTDDMTVTVLDKTAPVADAGPDMTVDEGTLVMFNWSASHDNVGIINFTWQFMDGVLVTLFGIQPTYRFDYPGIFFVTLSVTDAAGNWGTDTMTVTVKDITAPVANAGRDLIIDEKTSLMFNGSGSSDNVGVVNYTWTFSDGVPVSLYGPRPTYRFDNPGIFVVTLNVTDAAGNWKTDSLIVKVRDITSPVANAGLDQTVDEKMSVMFNGSGSSDNVGIVNYTWTFEYGAKRIVLSGLSPIFNFAVPGIYSVKLNVTDAVGFWTEDTMVITVRDITAPVANAGQDRNVPAGIRILFDGSRSTDNVAISKFFWNFTYGGKAQSLDGENVSFKLDNAGVYEVVLTVIDAAGNRGEDKVVVTVEPLVKGDDGGLWGLLWLPVLLIVMAAGAGYYVFMKRKRAHAGK
jgi:PKD repeat protein